MDLAHWGLADPAGVLFDFVLVHDGAGIAADAKEPLTGLWKGRAFAGHFLLAPPLAPATAPATQPAR